MNVIKTMNGTELMNICDDCLEDEEVYKIEEDGECECCGKKDK